MNVMQLYNLLSLHALMDMDMQIPIDIANAASAACMVESKFLTCTASYFFLLRSLKFYALKTTPI